MRDYSVFVTAAGVGRFVRPEEIRHWFGGESQSNRRASGTALGDGTGRRDSAIDRPRSRSGNGRLAASFGMSFDRESFGGAHSHDDA